MPSKGRQMDIDVSAEIVIDRARDDVATYVEDPENEPVWIGGIVESKPLTNPPVGVGTRVQRVATFMGRRMRYTPEVVEYDAGALLVMSTDSPFPMRISYQFEDAPGGGTVARIRIQGGGAWYYKLAGPLLGPAVRRNITKDLRRLKALLESEGDGAS